MGLFHLRRNSKAATRAKRNAPKKTTTGFRGGFEECEPRLLLAADINPLQVGAVYLEDAGGEDLVGDRFHVTFDGGVEGTQLTQLIIDTDKNENGTIDIGDCLFDTQSATPGAYGAFPFTIVEQSGIDGISVSVVDGGSTLILTFDGFDAGDKLVFDIDVDEQVYSGPSPVAEGIEFEGSIFTTTFQADHFYSAQVETRFYDVFDQALADSQLDLPPENYNQTTANGEPLPLYTAAAIGSTEQEALPITISGTVFEDTDIDGTQDTGETGLAGVQLALWEKVDGGGYVPTGRTTMTDASGDYAFSGVAPGTYRIVETQPTGYLSVTANAGTVDGTARGTVLDPDTITEVTLVGGEDSVDNDFAEVRPAALSGNVYHDADNDGSFDTGETGIGGTTIRVEWIGPVDGSSDDPFDPGTGDPGDPGDPFDNDFSFDLFGFSEGGSSPAAFGYPTTFATTTLADGSWSVDDLFPGLYKVTEVQPNGYLDGLDAAGTAGGTAQNPGDQIDQISLPVGTHGEEYNFGELLPATLSGYVYHDQNNNGVRDAGEAGIGNVTLTLYDFGGAAVATTTTGANGYYEFTGLAPELYSVVETHPAGYRDGLDVAGNLGGFAVNPGDRIDAILISSGDTGIQYNFGELIPASLSGYVYSDLNNNGLREAGESGIGGVLVSLYDATGNPTGQTAVTDANGFYEFDDLAPGEYSVRETQPAGYYDGLDTAGNLGGLAVNPGDQIEAIVISSGQAGLEYNFGELAPVSLSGYVYVDANNNGIRESGETPLDGVTVELFDANGNPTGQTAVTDADGFYEFDTLMPGTYSVVETQPTGYLDGRDTAGNLGGVAQNPGDRIGQIEIPAGQEAIEYNFGEREYASISGYVFQEGRTVMLMYGQPEPDPMSLGDGQFNSGDRPIGGVVLRLGDGSGAPLLDHLGNPITAVTNSKGFYRFEGLEPGLYTVYQDHPQGYTDCVDTAGTAGGLAINSINDLSQSLLSTLTVDPNNDAILEIYLSAGENGLNYNFSEVKIARMPPIIPPPRDWPDPVTPSVTPGAPIYVPMVHSVSTPVSQLSYPDYGGGGIQPGHTWHLSVINGGQPRDEQTESAAQFRSANYHYLAGPHFNPVSWSSSNMSRASWSFDGPEVGESFETNFGVPGSVPLTGDFNGDGLDELAIFVDGHWFVDLNGNGQWDESDLWLRLGQEGDQPVTGDWDGDGKTDIGIFGHTWVGDPRALAVEPGLPSSENERLGRSKNLPRTQLEAPEGLRYLKRTANGSLRSDLIDHVFRYGKPDDRAVAGDFNGDGISTVGVFREGIWYLDNDGDGRWSDGDLAFRFGKPGDLPVVGDFDGDGIDQIGIYRAGKWFIDSNQNREVDAQDKVFELGQLGDLPVVADFDGDGIDQAGLFQPQAAEAPQQAQKGMATSR